METRSETEDVSNQSRAVDEVTSSCAIGVDALSNGLTDIETASGNALAYAEEGVRVAQSTNSVIGGLGESSARIGRVLRFIGSIAEQTKLLALNATIEAARAGEFGKGFAVVAHEVKELARETALATTEVGDQLDALRKDSDEAISAIARLDETIQDIAQLQQEVAGQIRRLNQDATEISQDVRKASEDVSQITSRTEAMNARAMLTERSAADARIAIGEMAEAARELAELVATYRGPRL